MNDVRSFLGIFLAEFGVWCGFNMIKHGVWRTVLIVKGEPRAGVHLTVGQSLSVVWADEPGVGVRWCSKFKSVKLDVFVVAISS